MDCKNNHLKKICSDGKCQLMVAINLQNNISAAQFFISLGDFSVCQSIVWINPVEN